MRLDETPITILEKEIGYLKNFIGILETRYSIDPTVSIEKIQGLIVQCSQKIDEYEKAIIKLKS
jgi:hypothetical protein